MCNQQIILTNVVIGRIVHSICITIHQYNFKLSMFSFSHCCLLLLSDVLLDFRFPLNLITAVNRDIELSVIREKRDEAGNDEGIETRIFVGKLQQRVDDTVVKTRAGGVIENINKTNDIRPDFSTSSWKMIWGLGNCKV